MVIVYKMRNKPERNFLFAQKFTKSVYINLKGANRTNQDKFYTWK